MSYRRLKERVMKRLVADLYKMIRRRSKRTLGWHGLLTHRVIFDRHVAEAEQYGRHNLGDHSECNHS